MNLLLIGNGNWGKNYVKTINNFYPNIKLIIANKDNYINLINNKPDGVIIATPPDSHISIAQQALSLDIPVLIEKPIALSIEEVKKIEKYTAPILINYIHLFSQSYQNLKNIVQNSSISEISSLGFNHGPIRNYSSLWDYGCHDIAMILDLVKEYPQNIKIEQIKNSDDTSLYSMELYFKNMVARSLVGNGGKHAVRKFKINCEGLWHVYDDNNKYPQHALPLTNTIQVFINAINEKHDDRLGLDLSFNVIKILEKCDQLLDIKL